jgi:hypothetical protein
VVLRPAAVLGDPVELLLHLRRELLAAVDLLLGEQAGLDPLGELDLLLGVEQGDLADLLEVVLDRVGGGAGGGDLLRRGVLLVLVGQGERRVLLALRQLGGLRGSSAGCGSTTASAGAASSVARPSWPQAAGVAAFLLQRPSWQGPERPPSWLRRPASRPSWWRPSWPGRPPSWWS